MERSSLAMLFRTFTPNIEAETTVCGRIILFEFSDLGLTGPFDNKSVARSCRIPTNSVYSKTNRIFSEIFEFFT
jgi:hypothetical protein